MMMMMEEYDIVVMTCVVGMVVLLLIGTKYKIMNDKGEKNGIGYAKGGIPMLGHALEYKKDPVHFLMKQVRSGVGAVRINLAGRQMILITGNDWNLYQTICQQQEHVVSSIQAIASVGFIQTLGYQNVFHGTNFQKSCIKQHFPNYHSYIKLHSTPYVSKLIPQLHQTFQHALLQQQQQGDGKATIIHVDDLFQFVRNWHIRFILLHFLGSSFYQNNHQMNDIIDEFQILQDSIEEATAAATVLPNWISQPFILRPVERKRMRFQEKLQSILKHKVLSQEQDHDGPWLQSFLHDNVSIEMASEYIVGLLFAGAKNPAIASTQSYLLFHEHATPKELQQAKNESQQILSCQMKPNPSMIITKCVLETLRYIAHPIGAIRIVQKQITLGNDKTKIILEPGECVALSHVTVNHNHKLWNNDPPSNINFHRKEWAENDTINSTLNDVNDKFTTFSHGIHKCPGSNIALIMSQCSFAILLSHNITLSSSLPKVSFDRATLAQRSGPIPVQINTTI